jgi:hypothetical protein
MTEEVMDHKDRAKKIIDNSFVCAMTPKTMCDVLACQLAIEYALADVEIETLRRVAASLASCTSLEEAVLSVQVHLGVALAEADGEADDGA